MLLVAARLELMQTQCVVVDQVGFDVVAFAPHPIRIEVKATKRGAVRNNRLEFNTGKGKTKSAVTLADCDVVGLADLLRMRCLFLHVSKINRKNFKISENRFTPDEEIASWLNCIEETNHGKNL